MIPSLCITGKLEQSFAHYLNDATIAFSWNSQDKVRLVSCDILFISSYFRPAKTGLQLWYDEIKGDLAEEHPEMSEEELFTEGLLRFKQLDKEERKVEFLFCHYS